jgi:hypothetical protein
MAQAFSQLSQTEQWQLLRLLSRLDHQLVG